LIAGSDSGSERIGRPFGCQRPFSPSAALNRGVPSGQCGVGFAGGVDCWRFCADKDPSETNTINNAAATKRYRTSGLFLYSTGFPALDAAPSFLPVLAIVTFFALTFRVPFFAR